MLRSLALLLCLTTLAATDLPYGHADFYPSPHKPIGWRADGSGVYPGAEPPGVWKEDENLVWKTALPNWSNSGCIVVGDKVITFVEPHTLLAYDARTGEKLWHNATDQLDAQGLAEECKRAIRRQYVKLVRISDITEKMFDKKYRGPAATEEEVAEMKRLAAELKQDGIEVFRWDKPQQVKYTTGYFSDRGMLRSGYGSMGNSNACPVSDGEHVWITTGGNTVACYRVSDGATVWMRYLGRFEMHNGHKVVESNQTHHQFYAVPLLVDGILVAQMGCSLYGFDATSGKSLWEYRNEHRSTAGSPVLLRPDGERPVIATCRGWLVDPRDGRRHKLPYEQHGDSHHAPLTDGRDLLVLNGCIERGNWDDAKRVLTYRVGFDGAGAISAEQVSLIEEKRSQQTALLHESRYYYRDGVFDVLTGKRVGDFSYRDGYNTPVLAGELLFAADEVYAFPGGRRLSEDNGPRLPDENERGTDPWRREVEAFERRRQQAYEEGVIGWIDQVGKHGGHMWSRYGQLPTFQGRHIFVRTRMHLYCFGPGRFAPASP